MQKINMTVAERFGIRQLLNESYQRGGLTLDMLVSASKISEKCGIEVDLDKPNKDGVAYAKGGAEAKAVNLRQIITNLADGKTIIQFAWDAQKDKGKDLDFISDEIKFLQELIKNKSEKKELTLADGYFIGLNDKLNKKEE